MTTRQRLLGIVASTFSVAVACIAGDVALPTPQQAVEQLLRAEFAGRGDTRADLAIYSADYAVAKGYDRDPLGGYEVCWDCDPIVVVDSFEILDSKLVENAAAVNVEFHVLLRSEGTGDMHRDLVPARDEREQVRLLVTRKAACWLVLNPPEPRVSLDALLAFYQWEVDHTPQVFRSEAQRVAFEKTKETFEFLKEFAAKRKSP